MIINREALDALVEHEFDWFDVMRDDTVETLVYKPSKKAFVVCV